MTTLKSRQLENQLFVKRSQYIRVKNPLHKQSEKTYMCFKTRLASTPDYTVIYSHEEIEKDCPKNYDILVKNKEMIDGSN